MTDLQRQVLTAVQSGNTDEEKANLALDAVRFWYLQQGYFGRSYEIADQIAEELK